MTQPIAGHLLWWTTSSDAQPNAYNWLGNLCSGSTDEWPIRVEVLHVLECLIATNEQKGIDEKVARQMVAQLSVSADALCITKHSYPRQAMPTAGGC